MVAISVTDNQHTKFQQPYGVGEEGSHVDDDGVSIPNKNDSQDDTVSPPWGTTCDGHNDNEDDGNSEDDKDDDDAGASLCGDKDRTKTDDKKDDMTTERKRELMENCG